MCQHSGGSVDLGSEFQLLLEKEAALLEQLQETSSPRVDAMAMTTGIGNANSTGASPTSTDSQQQNQGMPDATAEDAAAAQAGDDPSAAAAAASADGAGQHTTEVAVTAATIAPAADPLSYFRHIISWPMYEGAASMTLRELAVIMRESVLQLGVSLHSLQDKWPDRHASTIHQLQEAFDRTLHPTMSLVMLGRTDIVEAANLMNLETLQPDEEGATQRAAKTGALIDRLDLSQQQRRNIAIGASVYLPLINSVVHERQRLQSQFAAAPDGCGGGGDGSSSGGGGGASAGSGSSSSSRAMSTQGGCTAEDLFSEERQQLLQAQERQADRLTQLMHKEFYLRMAGLSQFIGALSWAQIAKASVLCWPYCLRVPLLMLEICKREEEAQGGQGPAAGSTTPPAAT